jgi:hypothetical protein
MAIQAARPKKTVNEVTMLGTQFIRWGLGLFIFGLIIGYGPLAHYLYGALEQVGPGFLQNVTLWFGCPWTLSVYTVQVGSLGMVAIGCVYLHLPRDDLEPSSGISQLSGFAWPASSPSSSPATLATSS